MNHVVPQVGEPATVTGVVHRVEQQDGHVHVLLTVEKD